MNFSAFLDQFTKLENPYPGLRPFEPDDASRFFGRDEQIRDLIERLKRHRLVAVVGWSGSGKSSLVKAGLIPLLSEGVILSIGPSRIVMMSPRDRPIEELSNQIRAVDVQGKKLNTDPLYASSHGLAEVARQLPLGETLVIVVDQFEELFRFREASIEDTTEMTTSAGEAAKFVEILLTASQHEDHRVYIVLTMRSDYLGDCAEFRGLPEALNDAQYLVPRLTREQRRQAIEGPLGLTQMVPALVQRLTNESGDHPDQLPLLQHALARIWNYWRGNDSEIPSRPIDLIDYENDRIGALDDALDRHAEELFRAPVAGSIVMWPRLPGRAAPTITETIFKRLTAIGRGRRERRDPATLRELREICGADTVQDQACVDAVIEHFRQTGASFLNPIKGKLNPDTVIDITHESLIRHWARLKRWVEEEDASSKLLIRLSQRIKGAELTGLDLEEAAAWSASRNPTLIWARHYVPDPGAVLDYIARSKQKETERIRQAEEMDRKVLAAERGRLQILKVGLATLLVAVVVLCVSTLQFARQKAIADKAEAKAREEAALADFQRIRAKQAEDRASAAERSAEANLSELKSLRAVGDDRKRLLAEAQTYRDLAASLLRSASTGDAQTLSASSLAVAQIKSLEKENAKLRSSNALADEVAALQKQLANAQDEVRLVSEQASQDLALLVIGGGVWVVRRFARRRVS